MCCVAETLITGALLLKESHEDVGDEPVKGGGYLWDKGTELREGPGAAPHAPTLLSPWGAQSSWAT